ncbi:hypothetical protein CYMTET_46110 [Cymbomonas tetramitiformis]|uniref:WH2 domain-containing protein n=1 Tax=Cymbomonas tetramitiformis TaxID=36881 RepID=A0AAE0EXM2_9CHLO|nr:hypothetical protein CYMTET_46110 [Cymbomonas tetramitiformis]
MINDNFAAISLKPVASQADKSGPVIEADVKVGTVDRSAHLQAIQGDAALKTTGVTNDRSEPVIEPGVTVKPNKRNSLLGEVRTAGARRSSIDTIKHDFDTISLKPVTDLSDKGAPMIDPDVKIATVDRTAHLEGIAKGAELKPASETNDRSEPKLLPGLTVQPSKRGDVLNDVRVAGARRSSIDTIKHDFDTIALKPVTDVSDKGAPMIDPTVKIATIDRAAHLDGIAKGAELKPAPEVKDRSEPVIEADVKLQPSTRGTLFNDVRVAGARRSSIDTIKHDFDTISLKPVTDVSDKGAPMIDPTVKIATIDRAAHLDGIAKGAELKPASETNDRSEPVIEAEVKVQPNRRPSVLEDVKAAAVRRASFTAESA